MKYIILTILFITSLFNQQTRNLTNYSLVDEVQNGKKSSKNTSTISNKLVIGDDTFVITIDSLGYNFKELDYTYSFTLTLNGKKCLNQSAYPHKFIGCGYEFGDDKIEVSHVKSNDNQNLGWSITGLGSVCGNTYSKRTFFIFPFHDCTFKMIEVDSKKNVTINPVNETTLDLWYYEQHWGHTGTSGSFFVPKKRRISINYYEPDCFTFSKEKISHDIKFLESISEDYLRPDYIGLIAAGIENIDSELIKIAFRDYFNKEESHWYELQKVPMTEEEIYELVNCLEGHIQCPEKYSYLLQ